MIKFKKTRKLISITMSNVILLSIIAFALPMSNFVVTANDESSIFTDEFDTLDTDVWSFGSGITSKEIKPTDVGLESVDGDSSLQIVGSLGTKGSDFIQNAILNNKYDEDELNVTQTVEFVSQDIDINRWGIGLIAASDTSDPDVLNTSGNAYGVWVQLCDQNYGPTDRNQADKDGVYNSSITIFKIVNGEYKSLSNKSNIWMIPGAKQRVQFNVKNEDGIVQLEAKMFFYWETAQKWSDGAAVNAVESGSEALIDAGYQGMVYRNYTGNNLIPCKPINVLRYSQKGTVPEVIPGSWGPTGKPSYLLFERSANSGQSLSEISNITMKFDDNLAGKNLALSFMLRDITSMDKEQSGNQPGWTDYCGGYQDFYFTNYNDNLPKGNIVDPDIKDGDLYTFYIKGTDDLKFKIGMFGYTRIACISDVTLVEIDANHNPINDVNLADEYGDFSNWSQFKFNLNESGYIKTFNTTALTCRLFDISEGFFTTNPEPLEKEQMIYHNGSAGEKPHFIQYVRIPYEVGKVYEFTGKCKAWSSVRPAVRIDIQWKDGGVNAASFGAAVTDFNLTTGDFKCTFTIPEKIVQDGVEKGVPKLDDGRILLAITFQPGTSISTYAKPSFKEKGSDKELLFNNDFRLGFIGWQLHGTLGGIYRCGEILTESPDTYYNGEGTGGEAQLMELDLNMFWADTTEDYLPDEGEWWSEDMIKDEMIDNSKLSDLEGTLIDSKGVPISNADLLLISDEEYTQKTDANGYFKFKDLPEGTYELFLVLDDGSSVVLEEYIMLDANKIYTANLKYKVIETTNLSNTSDMEDATLSDTTSNKLPIINKPDSADKYIANVDSNRNILMIVIIIVGTVVLLAGLVIGGIVIYRKKIKPNA